MPLSCLKHLKMPFVLSKVACQSKLLMLDQWLTQLVKQWLTTFLSMDKEDVATFEKMRDLGVEFDVRKVPNDTKKDLFDLINKANVQ